MINEKFLRQQLERGISRIDVVGETVEEIKRNAKGTARWLELDFLEREGRKYGYTRHGNSWVKSGS